MRVPVNVKVRWFVPALTASSLLALLLGNFYYLLVLGVAWEVVNGLAFNKLYKTRNLKVQELSDVFAWEISGLLAFAGLFLSYFVGRLPSIALVLMSLLTLYVREVKGKYISPKVAFTLLFLAFTSTWFLSADLNLVGGAVSPNDVVQEASALGTVNLPAVSYVYNSFSVFVGILGTPWFSIPFGAFFLPLTLYRMVKARNLENRVRLSLMIFAYWVYSTYIPSFSPLVDKVQYIPYMWFNGLGTYGPVSPSYLLTGIVGTYVVTAVLSFAFGSRQICSVTCTAPYMLQGSFTYSLKDFNRTSRLGRKMLGSKLTWWQKASSATLMGSLLALAVVSYLDQEGVLNVTFLGVDPVVYLCLLYFNFLWYVQFLLAPFLGNYACVNMGVCQWGVVNQFFSYLGPFKLKVRDPMACVNCRTVDCAKACPVGITDMRGGFIKKGEMKSFKCIGAGDCIEACPEDNIFIYDVRRAIRERLSRKGG